MSHWQLRKDEGETINAWEYLGPYQSTLLNQSLTRPCEEADDWAGSRLASEYNSL